MTINGIVRNGKVELEDELPEGTHVRVLTMEDKWLEDWKKFAHEVSQAWKDPRSAVEVLSEMRR